MGFSQPSILDDVVVAAADEVPSHHELLAEWRAAEQQRPRFAVADVAHRELSMPCRLAGEVAPASSRLPATSTFPAVERHAMLERLVDEHPVGF